MRKNILGVLAITFTVSLAANASAQAPMGTWRGDQGSITFTLFPNGSYTILAPPLTGQWSWKQTGQNGGIIDFAYITPTPTQTFHNHLYFSIVYTGPDTATLTDPASNQRDTIRHQ